MTVFGSPAVAGNPVISKQIGAADVALLFGGADAEGGLGDWYLSNGVVEAVIDDAGPTPDLIGVVPPADVPAETGADARRSVEDLLGPSPVPVDELTKEFAGGATAEDICARSIRELSEAGVRHFYISNLPLGRAAPTLRKIVALASGVALP